MENKSHVPNHQPEYCVVSYLLVSLLELPCGYLTVCYGQMAGRNYMMYDNSPFLKWVILQFAATLKWPEGQSYHIPMIFLYNLLQLLRYPTISSNYSRYPKHLRRTWTGHGGLEGPMGPMRPPRFHGARRVLHRGACEVPSQNGAILASDPNLGQWWPLFTWLPSGYD